MSDEIDDEQINTNSSNNFNQIEKHNQTENYVDLPSSRISSSSSRKNIEEQSTYLRKSFSNESLNDTNIISENNSHQNTNQHNNNNNNNKLTNENQSQFHLFNEDPIKSDNDSLSSSYPNESLINKNKDSIDTNVDTDALQVSGRPKIADQSKQSPPPTPIATNEDDTESVKEHLACQFSTKKMWTDLQYHQKKSDEKSEDKSIKKPDELVGQIEDPPEEVDEKLLDRIQGSIIGMALGDALGAHVEFRPHQYLEEHPVTELEGGGTWGLQKGQFTDDTSMGLCLANSLVARQDFVPYDQLVRYKWWNDSGYMSSTGTCFDVGAATSQAIHEFKQRQKKFAKQKDIPIKLMDKLNDEEYLSEFDVFCSDDEVAGNGALMRLAPVPLFFFRNKYVAVEFSGRSGEITHGDKKAFDACRYYGALIVAALNGFTKKQILARNFYSAHRHWFGEEPLHNDIVSIAEGSFKKTYGWKGGIRGKGYIVNALEAALWAFWSDNGSFKTGALAAVNLGDDTDTTAAIYGQLAGAYYGYKELPPEWLKEVYAHEFMKKLSKWIAYEGAQWEKQSLNTDNTS